MPKILHRINTLILTVDFNIFTPPVGQLPAAENKHNYNKNEGSMKTLRFILSAVLAISVIIGFIVIYPSNNTAQVINSTQEKTNDAEQVFSDIAAIYYYGNGDTRIHTWINTGMNSFKYSGSNGWFSTKKGGYEGNKILRSVAGDWNGDGFTDLAGFYDYGNGITRIHVWLNNGGSRFNYQKSAGWWESMRGYDASRIAGVVSGDFNSDGNDDIAAFYDYGNNETRIHVWLSNGENAFKYEGSRGWWRAKGYPAKNIVNTLGGEFGE